MTPYDIILLSFVIALVLLIAIVQVSIMLENSHLKRIIDKSNDYYKEFKQDSLDILPHKELKQ